MLSKLALVGLAASTVASPICFEPGFKAGLQSLFGPSQRPSSIVGSCSSLQPGLYTIESKMVNENVQAMWPGQPLNVGAPSPHMIWKIEQTPHGVVIENQALTEMLHHQYYADTGRGLVPSAVTAASGHPTTWQLQDSDDGACLIMEISGACAWQLVDADTRMARIECNANAQDKSAQFEFRPVETATGSDDSDSCLEGTFKLVNLANGPVMATGLGGPLVHVPHVMPGYTAFEFTNAPKHGLGSGGSYIKAVRNGRGNVMATEDGRLITGDEAQRWWINCQGPFVTISVADYPQQWTAASPGQPFTEFVLTKEHTGPPSLFRAIPCGEYDC